MLSAEGFEERVWWSDSGSDTVATTQAQAEQTYLRFTINSA